MTLINKWCQTARVLIAIASMGLLPMTSLAQTKPVMTADLLQHLKKGEPWDRGVLTDTKMVMFQQAASGGTDATSVSKITLAYFTSSDCTGSTAGSGFYTTPDGTSFTINIGTSFGLVAASAWNVGSTKLSIADMTTIQSIAVTFKSTNNNTPQANFSGVSFACIPVTCTAGPGGQCTSTSGTQSFTLKTTAAIGDPADGGVIACMNGGSNNLVAPKTDNSTGIVWGGFGTATSATSTTDGATNTGAIVATLGSGTNYAARTCSTYLAAGGYTSGWFLPAGNNTGASGQLNCLFTNQGSIGGFASAFYWSSTEVNASAAWAQYFNDSGQVNGIKLNTYRVRCVRAFTP
jgi:hypothetical protein